METARRAKLGQAAETPQADAAVAKTATQTDDPQSLEALKKLGVSLKTDKDGLVLEVNARGAVVEDSALGSLTGLPRLKSLVLNDSGITDAGVAELQKTLPNTAIQLEHVQRQ